jgi:hypothetical protein
MFLNGSLFPKVEVTLGDKDMGVGPGAPRVPNFLPSAEPPKEPKKEQASHQEGLWGILRNIFSRIIFKVIGDPLQRKWTYDQIPQKWREFLQKIPKRSPLERENNLDKFHVWKVIRTLEKDHISDAEFKSSKQQLERLPFSLQSYLFREDVVEKLSKLAPQRKEELKNILFPEFANRIVQTVGSSGVHVEEVCRTLAKCLSHPTPQEYFEALKSQLQQLPDEMKDKLFLKGWEEILGSYGSSALTTQKMQELENILKPSRIDLFLREFPLGEDVGKLKELLFEWSQVFSDIKGYLEGVNREPFKGVFLALKEYVLKPSPSNFYKLRETFSKFPEEVKLYLFKNKTFREMLDGRADEMDLTLKDSLEEAVMPQFVKEAMHKFKEALLNNQTFPEKDVMHFEELFRALIHLKSGNKHAQSTLEELKGVLRKLPKGLKAFLSTMPRVDALQEVLKALNPKFEKYASGVEAVLEERSK